MYHYIPTVYGGSILPRRYYKLRDFNFLSEPIFLDYINLTKQFFQTEDYGTHWNNKLWVWKYFSVINSLDYLDSNIK